MKKQFKAVVSIVLFVSNETEYYAFQLYANFHV